MASAARGHRRGSRLCFRLEEPPEETVDGAGADGRSWTVRYLLQAADDPSLLLPAGEAWSATGSAASALRRRGGDVRPFLLASLGQASALWPPIEASLRSSAPAGHALDATGAHEFLTTASLLLEQAGFGVMLPAWWSRRGTRQRLAARAHVTSPAMQASTGLSLDRIVSVDWEIAIGDETLTLEELETLARLKVPLVRLRGQWVEMTAGDIETAIAFWKRRGGETAPLRDVVRMALGAGSPAEGLPVAGVRADGWVGDLLERLEGRTELEEPAPPAGFSGTLRPYQLRGYAWLAFLREIGLGACLADDMGLGKTIQALAFVLRDRERGERRPVLLVCPTSVATNWEREAARFTPDLPVLVHHGLGRKRGASFVRQAAEHGLVVSTYALLHRDLEHLSEVEWAGVLLDEAQNVKNPETKQSRAARSLAAGYRVALTGTPVENHNLTRANHVFHFDRWWNPAVEDQATDRAFRIGQTRDVQVVKLVCAGTMEEAVDELIEMKKGVAGSVVGSGEGRLTELSNDELRRLFALRAEAIGDD